MDNHKKKKAREIANFIVNNITLAEVSTIVIERSMEIAEYIVDHNLDPNDLNSIVVRKKLYHKLKEDNFKKAKNPFAKVPEFKEEEVKKKAGFFNWLFGTEEEEEESEPQERKSFVTKNRDR